jgi:hypothetical protein
MKYFYLDPDLARANPRDFKEAKTASDSDTYKNGDVVEARDRVFRWNSACVPLSKWGEWRMMTDELADAALPVLTGSGEQDGGTDLLARLEATTTRTHADAAAKKLWQQLHEGLKQRLCPSTELVLRGQAVFWRYAPQILASLLHFSLSNSFSSPRVFANLEYCELPSAADGLHTGG